VLYHRKRAYLIAVEDWEAARDLGLRSLALNERLGSPRSRCWHGAWTLDQQCQACRALGKVAELAGHADHLVEVASRRGDLRRAEAAGAIWQAVARRAKGDEPGASEAFHRGLALLEDLERRDSIAADGLAAYHEAGGDPRAALGVRDRELAEVSRKGMLHRAGQIRLERRRLLAGLGELDAADLEAVRATAARLRVPGWYLDRLRRFEPPGPSRAGAT